MFKIFILVTLVNLTGPAKTPMLVPMTLPESFNTLVDCQSSQADLANRFRKHLVKLLPADVTVGTEDACMTSDDAQARTEMTDKFRSLAGLKGSN